MKRDSKLDFVELFQTGKRLKSESFTAVYLKVTQASPRVTHCWGVVASKKAVSKRAHERNLAKRRLRALLRCYLNTPADKAPNSKLLGGTLNMCLIANKKVLTVPWLTLRTELEAVLAKC